MNPELETSAAQAAYETVSSNVHQWESAKVLFAQIGSVASLDVQVTRVAGQVEYVSGRKLISPLRQLKEASRTEHGSWISLTLTLTPDGQYSFNYNYDEEFHPRSGVDFIPQLYVEDLQKYPRPWAEIPDWHPVRQQYTEESWAAEVGKR